MCPLENQVKKQTINLSSHLNFLILFQMNFFRLDQMKVYAKMEMKIHKQIKNLYFFIKSLSLLFD